MPCTILELLLVFVADVSSTLAIERTPEIVVGSVSRLSVFTQVSVRHSILLWHEVTLIVV